MVAGIGMAPGRVFREVSTLNWDSPMAFDCAMYRQAVRCEVTAVKTKSVTSAEL